MGGLSLATCSVLHTARLLHAQGIGVGGRASVYGESQGSGNGSIYLAAASFSRVFTFYILIQLLTPWEAKSKCKSAIFCRIFPSALGRTWPAITTDQCRGETAKVVNLSPKYHGSVTNRDLQQVFFCSCQLLMGAWVPIQEISLSHASSSQSQSQPRNQTMGCVFWVSAQCASESLYQQH